MARKTFNTVVTTGGKSYNVKVGTYDASFKANIGNTQIIYGKNYDDLSNRPKINGRVLTGDQSTNDLGLNCVFTDTTANWNAQPRLVAKEGYIYVYSDYNTLGDSKIPGIKIGTGAYLIDTPFVSGGEVNAIDTHMADTDAHVSEADRLLWDNKVTCFMSKGEEENIVFSKLMEE